MMVPALLSAIGFGAYVPPWGDGFVDEGFPCARPPFRWEEVDVDELVFFQPTLRDAPRDGAGFARVARRLAESLPGLGRSDPQAAALARAALEGGAPPSGPSAEAYARLSLATGINAANLFAQAEPLHETLAVAAWVGILAAGRPALLPAVLVPALARCVEAPGCRMDALVAERLWSCSGRRQVLRSMRRASRLNRAVEVRPRTGIGNGRGASGDRPAQAFARVPLLDGLLSPRNG